MYGQSTVTERQIAAILLISGFFIFAIAGVLFTGRTIWRWPIGKTPAYLHWERGLVILALLVNIFGLVLLEDILKLAGDTVIAKLAIVATLIGATVGVIAETSFFRSRESVYPQIVFYVVVSFLAQAAFGAALLGTTLLAGWVGWVTIIWNLGWLILLVIASPQDIYYPALHHIAPLIIGITLLTKG